MFSGSHAIGAGFLALFCVKGNLLEKKCLARHFLDRQVISRSTFQCTPAHTYICSLVTQFARLRCQTVTS